VLEQHLWFAVLLKPEKQQHMFFSAPCTVFTLYKYCKVCSIEKNYKCNIA